MFSSKLFLQMDTSFVLSVLTDKYATDILIKKYHFHRPQTAPIKGYKMKRQGWRKFDKRFCFVCRKNKDALVYSMFSIPKKK